MANFLLPDEINRLKLLHKRADKKQRDKIKAILLLDKGYEYSEIAEILLIDYTTVWRWYETYITGGITELLRDFYLGGTSKLTEVQLAQLVKHLECTMYLTGYADQIDHPLPVQFTALLPIRLTTPLLLC